MQYLIDYFNKGNRYISNVKHNYVIPDVEVNTVFFYRIDCLGGIPLVVFLYDLYGIDGINKYKEFKINHCLHINNGIYPLSVEIIEQFCNLYIHTLKKCTYIGCWNKGYIPELYLIDKYCKNKAVNKPYNSGHEGETIWFNRSNWYEQLQGKKILIISSHAQSMEKQWLSNRLFKSHNKNISYIDTNIELSFVKPPMSACGLSPHTSWIYSLETLKKQVDETLINFDANLALVSCGAYGAPICDHIYSSYNKSVFYLGGALQLYFSIIGNRWLKDIPFNKYWSKLEAEEVPKNAHLIENACYF